MCKEFDEYQKACHFRLWHETVIKVQPPHVRCRRRSGKHVLGESISPFDPFVGHWPNRTASTNLSQLATVDPWSASGRQSRACAGPTDATLTIPSAKVLQVRGTRMAVRRPLRPIPSAA